MPIPVNLFIHHRLLILPIGVDILVTALFRMHFTLTARYHTLALFIVIGRIISALSANRTRDAHQCDGDRSFAKVRRTVKTVTFTTPPRPDTCKMQTAMNVQWYRSKEKNRVKRVIRCTFAVMTV